MFHGCYNGSSNRKHPEDIDRVIARAQMFNVQKMLITSSSIEESREHVGFVAKYRPNFASTVGVHPCTVAQEFYGGVENAEPLDTVNEKLNQLREIALQGHADGSIKAFGEIGLDYDRLHYSTKDQQCEMFRRQLQIYASIKHLQLPLFLHMRAACDDFVSILKHFIDDGSIVQGNGVVHSFTGTETELQKILDLGFYVGINGCSLKSTENLEVARLIPIEKLMIETDAPWCEIRKSHAGYSLISAYPNTYYPAIQEEGYEEFFAKLKLVAKLDAFLPFPSIKKEHFEKHTKQMLELLLKSAEDSQEKFRLMMQPLIKSRNEPVFVGFVAEIMARLHGLEEEPKIRDFIDVVYDNSCKLFKM